MAALSSNLAVLVYSGGDAVKVAIYAIRKVTTGDTLETAGVFATISYARFFILNRSAESAPAVSATTLLTFDAASIANDSGYLVVIGGAYSGQ